jgi:hypothetical protein
LIFIASDCDAASTKFLYGSNMEAAALSYDAKIFFHRAADATTANQN